LPLLIEWDVPQHPARAMPARGCRIVRIELRAKDASAIRRKLDAIDALESFSDITLFEAEQHELRVTLHTPNGEVTLSSMNSGLCNECF